MTTRDLPRMWRQPLSPPRASPSPPSPWAWPAGREGGVGAAAARREADGPGGRVRLLLRPAGTQGDDVGTRHPGLPFPRRAGRVPRPRSPPPPSCPGIRSWPACRRPARPGRSACRWSPWCTTSATGPVRQHAAGAQGDLADERRHLDPVRLHSARAGRRGIRGHGQAAVGRPGCHAPAAVLGAGVATYTSVLLCDTAAPAWHEGYREMPLLFAGSAAGAAGGLGMLAVRPGRAAQAGVFGCHRAAADHRQEAAAAPPGRPPTVREGRRR